MEMVKILIIEDEYRLSNNIKEYLESQGYFCEQAFSFDDARLKVSVYSYDCVLLDLMLPGGNGLGLLHVIRSRNNADGVIIISAKDSVDDRVSGLEIGADDYLPKPFALSELSMRIFALIRRKQFVASNVVRSNGVEIDLLRKMVAVGGHPIALTRTEYDLLLFFVGNRNKVLSKSAIAEHLSGEMADLMGSFDFIYSHIKNLKSKLSKAGVTDCIKTVYGAGYKWTE